MKYHARIDATIELVDDYLTRQIEQRNVPADAALGHYFRNRRYIGSSDRAEISRLFYLLLRQQGVLSWWLEQHHMPMTARQFVLALLLVHENITLELLEKLFSGDKYAPAKLHPEEQAFARALQGKTFVTDAMPLHIRYNVPLWLYDQIYAIYGEDSFALLESLMQEASTDLRVNRLKATVQDVREALLEEGITSYATPMGESGLRLEKRAALFGLDAFRNGWFEVQDAGSQYVADIVNAQPGHKVIDFCAGAGGKTLAMAAKMENKGRILACDTNEPRLKQMTKRLRRAGVHNVTTRHIDSEHDGFLKRHKDSADRVLIDVPCSGSGTWRRNPDLKWRTTPFAFGEMVALQQRILGSAARLVKAGGQLIYATCSILEEENTKQIERFLLDHPHYTLYSVALPDGSTTQMMQLLPHRDEVDGFFVAVLERNSS